MRRLLFLTAAACLLLPAAAEAQQPAYITSNPYLGDTISSYDARVSPYSPYGARNQYTTDGGRIYGQDGQYLGRLNANPYDPESVANPYGRYGSEYSQNSINNPYGKYGSEYSPYSATNPYSTTPPVVIYGRDQTSQPATVTNRVIPKPCNPWNSDCDR